MNISKKKYIPFLVIPLTFFVILLINCGLSKASNEKIDYNNWILEWSEEFNGDKLDSTTWGVMPRAKDGGCRNYISANHACYDLSNGILTIKAIKNTVDPTDTARYLTGGIQTRSKKSFPPGLIEIKAKFNGIKGKTCGIWMLPFTSDKGWPTDGEIDIMEHGASQSYITQTVHTGYTKKNENAKPQRYIMHKVNYEDFNVYGVEISEDSLSFFVNGIKNLTYPRVDSLQSKGQYPFYKEWFLLLSTASRGPFDSICAPLEMQVDWVRY